MQILFYQHTALPLEEMNLTGAFEGASESLPFFREPEDPYTPMAMVEAD